MTSEISAETDAASRRDRVLAVAIECFARYGVHRTRMEDISDAAGLSRPAVYLEFASRQDLIDAVMQRQLMTVVGKTAPRLLAMETLAAAIIEGSVLLISALRDDQVNLQLLAHTHRERLVAIIQGSVQWLLPISRQVWRPVLAQARERGEVREHLAEDDGIADWLASVHTPYLFGESADFDKLRREFGQFVVPAICRVGAGASAAKRSVRKSAETRPIRLASTSNIRGARK
jgi:AcrR family transcriptional regulator